MGILAKLDEPWVLEILIPNNIKSSHLIISIREWTKNKGFWKSLLRIWILIQIHQIHDFKNFEFWIRDFLRILAIRNMTSGIKKNPDGYALLTISFIFGSSYSGSTGASGKDTSFWKYVLISGIGENRTGTTASE